LADSLRRQEKKKDESFNSVIALNDYLQLFEYFYLHLHFYIYFYVYLYLISIKFLDDDDDDNDNSLLVAKYLYK